MTSPAPQAGHGMVRPAWLSSTLSLRWQPGHRNRISATRELPLSLRPKPPVSDTKLERPVACHPNGTKQRTFGKKCRFDRFESCSGEGPGEVPWSLVPPWRDCRCAGARPGARAPRRGGCGCDQKRPPGGATPGGVSGNRNTTAQTFPVTGNAGQGSRSG